MNTFVIIIVLIIGFIIYNNKKMINNNNNIPIPTAETIEKFNNYTIIYLLHLLHKTFGTNNLWYIIIGDTLDSIVNKKSIPSFSSIGYILMNKSDEEKINKLNQELEKMNLKMRKNINSIEITTEFNKNIHIMIYLINNNNGMLEICSTSDQLECKSKCCKLEGSNIDMGKFTISYADANPRMIYTIDNIELYGPNKFKNKSKQGCDNPKKHLDVYNKKDELLLNQYINEVAGKTNTIIPSTYQSTKGMNKIPPLEIPNGYNYYTYKSK